MTFGGSEDCRRLHVALVIDYDHGSILACDIEQAIEDFLGRSRHVVATAVIVSEGLHQRLLAVAEGR